MKKFLSSIFTAVPLVLAVAGLSFGQTAATATWQLDSTANVSVSGNVNAMPESITGLQSAYETPPAGTTTQVQKLKPDATTSGTSGKGSWPTETAPNGERYVEFSIAPQANFGLTINSVSMMIGNKGIKGMNASIYYSTKSSFADSTKLVELDSLFENGVIDTTFGGLSVVVNSGETLYIRAYPWLSSSSTSTSKYFYIGNVVVSGTTTALPNPSLSTTLDWNFQSDAIGASLLHIGWSQSDIQAVVADDPVNPGQGNNVLKCTVHNYNAAPVLEAVLPAGKTLADYDSLAFEGFFQKGDIGYKDIVVEAYQTKPTGHFLQDANAKIGDYNRAKGASTNWEQFSIGISNTMTFSDTVYIAFGINCNGTANGDTTTWFADNIMLVAKQAQPPGGPTLVHNWGTTPMGQDHGWTILNTASTPDGNASMGGTAKPTGWMTIKGGFDSLTATTSQAFVITGNLDFVGGGGGSAYTWFRYSLFDGNGTLSSQNTDSARWSGTTGGYGYIFTPVSGSGTISNTYHSWPQGNQGTEWPLINSGSWISTNSNGGGPFSTIMQAPYHQAADSGSYSWAISVQPLSTGGNEVRWYLIQDHAAGSNNYYWWGGSLVDTAATAPTSFNSIGFAINNDNTATEFKLSNVSTSLGSPITVPEAPFQPFYVNMWGATTMGSAWPILNDSNYVDGNAGMGNGSKTTGWATIRGGFQEPVTATTGKAVNITGQLEFVGGGGGSAYTWLRYALFNEANDTLHNQNTPTASWTSSTNGNGYIFTPVSGSGTISNTYHSWPQGNQGTEWPLINSKSWISTNSNGGGPISTVLQAPYHQAADSGTYDWAISVQPLITGGNEVRWYLIQEHVAGSNNYYWWGGSFVDTAAAAPTTFNSIGFAVNNDNNATQVNLMNVEVTKGAPITVPEAPFQPFYVNMWGATTMGSAWPILNDTNYVDGNAAMGNGSKTTGWATIRGGFQEPVTATTGKAVNITGQLEFVGGGGGSAYTWLRYALFNEANDTLHNQNTDTASWTSSTNGNGYIFTPVSGSGTISNTYHSWPQGNQGTEWPLINSKSWISTNSNGGGPISTVLQAPYHQVADSGTYDWAISVQPLSSGANEVRWYLIQEHVAGSNSYYWWGGSFVDTAKAAPTTFNSIGFAVNNDNTATQVNLMNVEVTKGAPITVPEAPFQSFYPNMWGATSVGSAWPILNDSSYVDGDAAMGNGSATTGWASIRGGFQAGSITASTSKAFIISGKMDLVGGGGGSGYTWLRYALFNGDGTLTNQNTDSASWSGATTASGYIFTPVSGGGTISNTYHTWPQGNQGTEWALNNSASWNSTNNNNGGPFSTILQSPYHQPADSGVYDWAISVQPLSTGGTEVKWYLIQEHVTGSTNYYWWGGSFVDTSSTAPISFNSIGFAVNNDNTATEVKLTDVEVNRGSPINIPKKPFTSFYIPVANWGFYGSPTNRIGGWKLTPGDIDGNVSISGSGPVASNQWAAIRGGFQSTIALSDLPPDTALVITGTMQFVGGGFGGMSGLRFGIFYSDSAGVEDSTQQYGQMWTGKDSYSSGYLISPNSGTNSNPGWGSNGDGSVGGVVNSSWLSTSGSNDYILSNMTTSDVAGAGTYNFIISVKPLSNGNVALGYSIKGPNYTFVGDTVDSHNPVATTKFNAINFAVDNTDSKTTGLNITNVQVALGSPIVTSVNDKNNSLLPTEYSLSQNYPNPFNPSTTIQFALPKSGNVTLKVYDILGRLVTTLVSGDLNAGYHTIHFNAADLASGVYFYRIKAGNFIKVKKLMLLK